MSGVRGFVEGYNWFVLGYFVLLNLMYLGLLSQAALALLARVRRGRSERPEDLMRSPLTPGVTVIVPAYNEQAGIVDSVRSLVHLRYPHLQVIVVSDGSDDATVDRLHEAFDLAPYPRAYVPEIATAPVTRILRSRVDPRLVVAEKLNGGKADALNCGINLADEELICSLDADAILDPDALLLACRPFVEEPDLVVATGGIVRIANGCVIERGHVSSIHLPRSPLAAIQVIEYLRAFVTARAAWSRMNALLIISGAFGVFRADLVRELGGYRTDTVGEDGELVVRIHRHMRELGVPYRVAFVPDPVCWTEAPEELRVLRRQRARWQRGLAEILWIHRGMGANPRYGAVGLLALPATFAFELLGPVVEATGVVALAAGWWLGVLSMRFLLLFVLVALVFGLFLSVTAVVLEEASARRFPRVRQLAGLLLWSVVEQLGYRQLHAAWRTKALVDAARGHRRGHWGDMRRRGLARPSRSARETGTSA
jgi:cellulose synthase/poly-beta-1,6-N-acetylglucosamine synthase-like glycosyltransferase